MCAQRARLYIAHAKSAHCSYIAHTLPILPLHFPYNASVVNDAPYTPLRALRASNLNQRKIEENRSKLFQNCLFR